MGHLLEILLNILGMILPMPDRKRSSMGESQMDKGARISGYMFYGLLALAVVVGIVWYSLR